MHNIAVVGRMHSGKSTFASELITLGYTRFAFADPVKEIAAKMLTTFVHEAQSEEQFNHRFFTFDDMQRMKGEPAIRKLLQLVGTDLGRVWLGPDDIWINKFKESVRKHEQEARILRWERPIVNDDCRFPNEAAALRDLGFTIVKLVRNEAPRRESVYRALKVSQPTWSSERLWEEVETMQQHPSETEVDKIVPDTILFNSSLDVLKDSAKEIACQK